MKPELKAPPSCRCCTHSLLGFGWSSYERNAGFEQFTQPAGPTRRNRGPATSVRPTVDFLTGFHTSLSGTSPQSHSFPARFLSPLAFQHVFSVPSLSGTFPQSPPFPARFLSPLDFRHVFSGSSLSGNLPQSPRFPAPLFSPNWLEEGRMP